MHLYETIEWDGVWPLQSFLVKFYSARSNDERISFFHSVLVLSSWAVDFHSFHNSCQFRFYVRHVMYRRTRWGEMAFVFALIHIYYIGLWCYSIFAVIIFSLLHIIISDWIYVCISHSLLEHNVQCVCIFCLSVSISFGVCVCCTIYSYFFPLRFSCDAIYIICENLSIIPLSCTSNRSRSLVQTGHFYIAHTREKGTAYKFVRRNGNIVFFFFFERKGASSLLSRFSSVSLALSPLFHSHSRSIFTLCFFTRIHPISIDRAHTQTHGILLMPCRSLIYFSAMRRERERESQIHTI